MFDPAEAILFYDRAAGCEPKDVSIGKKKKKFTEAELTSAEFLEKSILPYLIHRITEVCGRQKSENERNGTISWYPSKNQLIRKPLGIFQKSCITVAIELVCREH
jgi:hypothetical protein